MVVAKSYLKGYSEALDSAVFYPHSSGGYLRLAGPDRIEFLQRQTSNDVRRLSEQHAVLTVLTSPTAKIVDVLWLVADPDAIGIMTLPGRGADTAAFLRSRIFFMDKVTVEDASASVVQIDLEGPRMAEFVSMIGLQSPGPDEVTEFDVNGVAVQAVGLNGLLGPAVRLLVSAKNDSTLEGALLEAGFTSLAPETRQVLRVESGHPGEQAELTEEYSPLEVRLNHAISDSKGCYTGQEIIARQTTYDKVTRSLIGLELSGQVDVGSKVIVEGRTAGEVTSVVESPRLGWIGLGVVKRPHNAAGVDVSVKSGQGEVTAIVRSLPFA
jgi:folate-binding protein YgfZ